MAFLLKKRANPNNKGWLRQLESRLTGCKLEGKPKDEEKNLALKLYLCLQSSTGAADAIACAWGVTKHTIYNWKTKADQSDTMVVSRKKRADAGQTVFTSDSRRAATYTEGNIGPLRLFAARAKEGESISYAEASKEYSSAPTVFKAVTIAIAEDFKERSPFLEADLKRVLTRTNGCISWVGLERALNEDGGGGGEDGIGIHHSLVYYCDPRIPIQNNADPSLPQQRNQREEAHLGVAVLGVLGERQGVCRGAACTCSNG
jgi:hypothetical protein